MILGHSGISEGEKLQGAFSQDLTKGHGQLPMNGATGAPVVFTRPGKSLVVPPGTGPIPIRRDAKAEAIVRSVEGTYRALKSYTDTGEFSKRQANYQPESGTFRTYFVAPRRLRLSGQNTQGSGTEQFEIRADGKRVFASIPWMPSDGESREQAENNMSLNAVLFDLGQDVGYGVSIVPQLLTKSGSSLCSGLSRRPSGRRTLQLKIENPLKYPYQLFR